MKLGFIGLGHIGQPMALCLARAGHELIVHDLDESRAEPLVDLGARWSATSAGVCAGTEAVLTSLPGPPQVKDVLESENGLLAGFEPEQTWIEMSTSDAELLKSTATALQTRNMHVLESTVTGGVAFAKQAKATLLVGGDRPVYERFSSALNDIATTVVYVGPLGNSTVVKLITNMLAFVHEAALAEGLTLGIRAGVEPAALLEGIQKSYGGSFVADVDGPKALTRSYDSEFSLELALKDMRLTHALADQLGLNLSYGAAIEQTLEATAVRHGYGTDVLSVLEYIEAASSGKP